MNNYALNGSVGDFFDSISTFVKNATDTYNQNAAILDPLRDAAIKNAVSSGGSTLTVASKPPVPPPVPPSTPAKISWLDEHKLALVTGGVALAGVVTYLVVKKKKKK